ncbi:MAG: hypothetical protein EBZ59_13330, partial [Planctomycetia bacterium]|nr:hypothetical protein [Planctomycetia bacterium]
ADTSGTAAALISGTSSPPTATAVLPRTDGIFSSTTDPAASPLAVQLFAQSRDDVVFVTGTTVGTTADDPPVNSFSDSGGVRSFQGRITCLLGIRFATTGTLSAVVFHGRDPSTLAVTGTITNGSIATSSLVGLGDRTARDVLKPGVVCYGGATNPRFHQAISVSFPMLDSTAAAASTAYVTFSTGTAILNGTHTLTIFPDSVGLAERTFTAETSGPYLQ